MALIKTLKNKLGEILYPRTLTSAVYAEDGTRLDAKLNEVAYVSTDEAGKKAVVDASGNVVSVAAGSSLPEEGLASGNILAVDEDGSTAVWVSVADAGLVTKDYLETETYTTEKDVEALIDEKITGAITALY